MTGIAGIVYRDHSPCDSALLGAMQARLKHRGEEIRGHWIVGHVGLAANGRRVYPESTSERQPCVDDNALIAAVFDGRLDNRAELLRIGGVAERVSSDAPDIELVIEVFREKGGKFANFLLGDFACAVYDRRNDVLYLARDPIGVRPLYYMQQGRRIFFGSEIRCFIIDGLPKPKPDYGTLSQFLQLGGMPEDRSRTFFANVRAVMPGQVVALSATQIRTQTVWDFDPTKTIRYSHHGDYVEAFRSLLEVSLKRRLRSTSPVGIALSGGLDSSSLYGLGQVILARGEGPPGGLLGAYMDYGPGTPADELAHIQAIEHRFQSSVARIKAEKLSYFSSGLEPFQRSEAPIADITWGTAEKLREFFSAHGARVALTGHWGDQVLFEQRYLIDLLRTLRFSTLFRHLNTFGRWFQDADSTYYRSQFYRDAVRAYFPTWARKWIKSLTQRNVTSISRQIYEDGFLRATAGPGPNSQGLYGATEHAKALYERIHSSAYQLALATTNKVGNHWGLEFAFPFLDRELLTFLMAIPGEVATRDGVPKALLRDAMANYLPASVCLRDWKADSTFIEYDAYRSELPEIRSYLLKTTAVFDHRIARRENVRRVVASRTEPATRDHDIDWSLEYFLGACQWLESIDFEDRGEIH